MALVSKIREKSGLIVFIVGLGLLLFIIPFDSIYSFFAGGGEQPIGQLYGRDIYPSEWDVMGDFDRNSGRYSGVQDGEMYKVYDARQEFQGKMIDTIMKTEIAKIGLQVGAAELKDYLIFGKYPSRHVLNTVRGFYDMDEEVDEQTVKDSIPKMYNTFMSQLNSAQADQKANIEANWVYGIEIPAKTERLKQKYLAMAKYSVVGTTDEATKLQIAQNSKLVIDFVAKEVGTVLDTSITIPESKIKSYYDAHKDEEEWKVSEDKAVISYVLINVDPTQEDTDATMEELAKMKKGFAAAPNDTAFINIKSDTKFGESYQAQGIQGVLDVMPSSPFNVNASPLSVADGSIVAKAKKGEVVGPFINQNSFADNKGVVLVKIRDIVRNSTVRHILVTDKVLADSIANVLRTDSTQFDNLALLYSNDKDPEGIPNNGGYYDVTPEASLVPSFKNFALQNEVGAIEVVPSQYGYHVMEVTEKVGDDQILVSYIEKFIKPSENTRNKVYEDQGFGFMNAAESNYEAACAKFGFESQQSTLYLAQPIDATFKYSKELVSWLFAEGREVGEISVPIELSDGRYIVAKIDGVGSYGVPTYEVVRDDMEAKLIQEEKMAQLKKNAESAGSLKDAEGLLTAVDGVHENVEISLDMDAFPGFGQDAQAIAKTFLIGNLNELNIIEGKQGIYAIVVKERKITPVSTDKTEAITTVSQDLQGYVDRTIQNALLKMADVRDWRMKAQVHYDNQTN